MTHFYTRNDFFVPPSQPITVIKGHFTASGSIQFTLCAWFSSGEIRIKRAEGLQIVNDFYSVWNYIRFKKKKKNTLEQFKSKKTGTWRVWHRSVFSCYDFMLLKRNWCRNVILLTITNRFQCCSIRCQSFGNFQGLSTLRLECNVTIRHLES